MKALFRTVVYLEIGITLYERFQNHLSTIRRKVNTPITDHFTSSTHTMKDIEKIIGLEKIKTNDLHLRKLGKAFG